MCTVMAAIGTILSVGQTVAGYMGQASQAKAEQAYENQLSAARAKQIADNNALAQQSFYNQQTLEQQRLNQLSQEKTQKETDVAKQFRAAQATAATSAGESGVSGISIDSLMADYFRQQYDYVGNLEQNYKWDVAQSQEQMKASKIEAQGRMQSIQPYIPRQVTGPSALGAALQIGTGIFEGVAKARKEKKGIN